MEQAGGNTGLFLWEITRAGQAAGVSAPLNSYRGGRTLVGTLSIATSNLDLDPTTWEYCSITRSSIRRSTTSWICRGACAGSYLQSARHFFRRQIFYVGMIRRPHTRRLSRAGQMRAAPGASPRSVHANIRATLSILRRRRQEDRYRVRRMRLTTACPTCATGAKFVWRCARIHLVSAPEGTHAKGLAAHRGHGGVERSVVSSR